MNATTSDYLASTITPAGLEVTRWADDPTRLDTVRIDTAKARGTISRIAMEASAHLFEATVRVSADIFDADRLNRVTAYHVTARKSHNGRPWSAVELASPTGDDLTLYTDHPDVLAQMLEDAAAHLRTR